MEKFDRNKIIIAKREDIDEMDNEYWRNASIKGKITDSNLFEGVFLWKRGNYRKSSKSLYNV